MTQELSERPYAESIRSSCSSLAKHDPRCVCILHAIAKHDSAYASSGIGKKHNNIGNIRCLKEYGIVPSACAASLNGNGHFASFDSVDDSIIALADLYVRKYAGRSPDDITRIYAGNPQSSEYWKAVRSCYNLQVL